MLIDSKIESGEVHQRTGGEVCKGEGNPVMEEEIATGE